MNSFKDLIAYKKAEEQADEIFEISKTFPIEERYSLTGQIRRGSRSVCICIAESYRKRIYPAHLVSKLSDADMENAETEVWLDFSKDCKYLTVEKYDKLVDRNNEIGKLLGYMIKHPEKYCSYDE
ncbi:MAG TPA: four helix bundle protein [Chitinophagaceae bacterium]|jgi:four helix bundle protein